MKVKNWVEVMGKNAAFEGRVAGLEFFIKIN
jgi:hypothetical protein